MPFKSEAQRAKFRKMVATGEITQKTFDEWDKETPTHLPKRLNPPRKTKKK